ncbi:MAG TPA: sensor domain-containing diguanylate cyclase [Gammaproteobacteria bacterium]|nr:sensor domain-containing diguanylate cyclase [Gammaproteobacteria bacterium]
MSYTSRMFVYVGMLMLLLSGMMLLSFRAATDIVVTGSRDHLRHTALRKQDAIREQSVALRNYTSLVAKDQRLQEYLFIVTELEGDSKSLARYYERQYANLPVDMALILSANDEVLYRRGGARGLLAHLKQDADAMSGGIRLYRDRDGLLEVAVQPVEYEQQRIGYVVLVRCLDQAWLQRMEEPSDDYLLFFEQDNRMLWSSNPLYRGFLIDFGDRMMFRGKEAFYLQQVRLPVEAKDMPRLWFAASETRMLEMLNRYRNWAWIFTLAGGGTIMLIGWLMIRNFKRPFRQMMDATEAMIQGRLPVIRRSDSRTELDRLLNRFADVLDALRREKSKVKRAHRKLQQTAITDSLTGLYNRRYLQEVAPALFAQARRDRRYVTAILLDLDYFKSINDRYGHLGGDAVLVHFSRLLRHNSRANDHLFRIGGEEFMILNVADRPQDSLALAEKLRELAESSPATYQGEHIYLTVSAGLACVTGVTGDTMLSQLMRSADQALYEAKAGGRNRVVAHTSCTNACGRGDAGSKRPRLSIVREARD